MTEETEELKCDVWGEWDCPECGDTCQDRENVWSTTCHNNHNVFLTAIDDHGQRQAFLQP